MLATVITLATVCLVLPSFTTSGPGPVYTGPQLAFAAIASLVLYALFVFTQTIRHRDFFLPVSYRHLFSADTSAGDGDSSQHDHATSTTTARRPAGTTGPLASAGLLLVSLVAVVGLAKIISPAIEDGVDALGFPNAVVGVVIALLCSASPSPRCGPRPQGAGQPQPRPGLGDGIDRPHHPDHRHRGIWLDGPLALGLDNVQIVLLFMTVVVAILTVVPGRAKPLQGGVHLVLLASFIF